MLEFNLVSVVCIAFLISDSISSVRSIEVTNDTQADLELLIQTDYCYVNNCTVRRRHDGTNLTIVNDTGDWLVVSNDGEFEVELFLLPTNISDCKDDFYSPDIVIYAVQTVINCITLLLACGTIFLHLHFKRLQTVFGMLITILCFFVAMGYVVIFVHNRYQYTHKVNDSSGVCAMLLYVRGTFIFLYHSTVVTVFYHFTKLMYNTYKVRSVPCKFDAKLFCKYITFIVSLTMVCALLIVPYDLSVTRNTFATADGYCEIEFEDHVTESFYIYITLLSLIIAAQMIIFSLGLILYFLSNKNFCEFKTINIRVCLALISTSGLNTLLFLMSYSLSGSTHIPILLSSIATVLEQFVLLMIFCTSVRIKTAPLDSAQ